uniref:F-box domain-containing protein n=1 Tax=Strongyloides papillosus TaxID=174720 RepID=A0A0N5BE41_STREA
QFSSIKNPTIFFESLNRDGTIYANDLNELINTIIKYNIKVKLKIDIDCPEFEGQCENCTDTISFFSSIKQYVTAARSRVIYYNQSPRSIEILKIFKNLSTLNLKFRLDGFNFQSIVVGVQKPRDLELQKLNGLKNLKLEYDRYYQYRGPDASNPYYQSLEFICSIMPRSVKVLQFKNIRDMDDVIAKMITRYMQNIKLLNIECLSYKERDNLVEEEPKKEVLEEAKNQLYSITFRHTDLRPLHSYIQRTSKLIATLFEQDCNSDLVEQIATFHCIMRMPKDLTAAFFKHLEKEKEVLCKESFHNWATRNKTSIHQRLKKKDTPKIIGLSHWTIKALIGNVKLSTTMYLDSCSGFNYLSMKSWKDLGEPSLDLLDTVEIKDVGANIISCLGALVIPVVLDNIEHTCTHKLKIPQFKVAI